ncbi:kinesin-like protein KIF27 [Xenopus laevis]|uniref:Kinesin-like protein KIF27 n=2 Tax=Xenopus laevis TaxID=8355 RepID=A0A1L8I2Y5_XENLA|nr:kinesin-like protein KIF27 [Xenopus laevis]XP_018122750.1 kinesin-like protein KIF27 [Xenopus laevis]XP_018122767.1 kinesin-like protein KIF27 [Xenopus laevis]OCU02753.1 hypothetical protein XELAEV_18008522mg [Xenopus laevis]
MKRRQVTPDKSTMEEIPVKVVLRVRPLLSREILHNHQVCVRLIPNTQQIIVGKDRLFTYDSVFGKSSSQEDVYRSCIKPLLVSLMEGYNATVFAYGQTGSGKTYTIGGGNVASVADEEKGIIPRAIQELFQCIAERHNIDFSVRVSYIEVYKEELLDLLELETNMKDLHIREDEKGNTVIVGAKECQVETADEVMSLLAAGSAARHTGSTQMNERSSRSHAIFTITICQQSSQPGDDANSTQTITSKFHFVDLAGSERVTKTGNTGERFKESIQINSGLLALGNVISALGDPKRKSAHIPYRDAKITRILKDSLGGNAKTVMITCISPSSSDLDESLNSLKYANRARNIKNKPVVNYNPDWDRMDEMELEIKVLREALQNHQSNRVSRTSQVSQEWSQGKDRIRSLEEEVAHLQLECFNQRHCTEEAFSLFLDLKDISGLTQSEKNRVEDWLHLAEGLKSQVAADTEGSSREEPHHITILQLKRELKKCQDALLADEEVFARKKLELKELQEQIQSVQEENEAYQKRLQEAEYTKTLQTEKLVEQQLLIDELKSKKPEIYRQFSQENEDEEERPREISQRPHTVPPNNPTQKLSSSLIQATGQAEPRKVRTSPPSYSLERMVAGFRTRSQMLLELIEEQDEVLHEKFSDQSEEESDEPEKENRKKSPFSRSINRTWTRRQASAGAETLNSDSYRESVTNADAFPALESLRESQVLNMEKLKTSDIRLADGKQRMRELTINIKMKEELIEELVKTGNDAQSVNKQYSMKIAQLEGEAEQAKSELAEAQRQLQELENKELRDVAHKAKLQRDFRKKMEEAKLKMQAVQTKQQDTTKLASLSVKNEKRVRELELNVDQMRQQQAKLQRKLKTETDMKRKLESTIQKEQERIRELQLKTEQQNKILRMKNEEIAAIRRRKSVPSASDPLQLKVEEQTKWLDEEVEKVLKERQALTELEEDLRKREESITKMEALLQEKSQLEMKKLRSSQALSSDVLKLSNRLNVLENELMGKSQELQSGASEEHRKVYEDVRELQKERDGLLKRRDSLDEKLRNGSVLSREEEHTLFQLEEGIEALEAAIEYKNDYIQNRHKALKDSSQILTQSEANIIEKFSSLSPSETRSILVRYFNKVVSLREAERKLQLNSAELRMKVEEKENMLRELESSLEHLLLQNDRRLTQQQKEHEQKLQLLLQHFKDNNSEPVSESIKAYEAKVAELEKELFFYKKTSRELKKKLKELLGDPKVAVPKNNNSADAARVLDHPGPPAVKELKWTPQLESNKAPGKTRESQHSDHNPHLNPEAEPPSSLPKLPSRSRISRRASSEEEEPGNIPAHFLSKMEPSKALCVTPVKISRRDVRQISASHLSSRRSSLTCTPADSIEITRTGKDFNAQ